MVYLCDGTRGKFQSAREQYEEDTELPKRFHLDDALQNGWLWSFDKNLTL